MKVSARKKRHALLVKKAIAIQAKIETLKAYYDDLDEIVDELVATGFQTTRSFKRTATLVDMFAHKNVAFTTTSIKRYKLVIS